MDKIVWIGHATVLVELGAVRILTDPVLRDRLAHLRRAAAPPTLGPRGFDAVLLSHLHRDHADGPSLRSLAPETPVLVPPGAARVVRGFGLRNVREVAIGESVEIAHGVVARAVPADHDGRRWPWGRPAVALGWMVEGARTIYFAGDSDVFDEMERAAAGADVALLPVWGWGPRIGPGHMDPDAAATAAALLRPRIAVPIHWGTFLPWGMARRRPELLRFPGPAFADRCAVLAPDVDVAVLSPGESLELTGARS